MLLDFVRQIRWVRRRGFGAALATLAMAGRSLGELPRSATDEQVRPVLLYQLAQYVNWPETKLKAGDSLRFCVFDDAGLAEALAAVVRGKQIQGHSLTVEGPNAPEAIDSCHVAFLGAAKSKPFREMLAHWQWRPVLLVGEAQGFAQSGGMVNLKVGGGRMGLEINREAAERSGLQLRSQLLRLAEIVGPGGGKR